MANMSTYTMIVHGEREQVSTFVEEVRMYQETGRDGTSVLSFAKWGWPVEDGPRAYSFETEIDEFGRIIGSTYWCPPLRFIEQLSAHRPLLVECVSTTGNEEHERWVAWRGECHHLLTFVSDPKDEIIQTVRVAGKAADDPSLMTK